MSRRAPKPAQPIQSAKQKLDALMPLIHLGSEAAPSLPPHERADLYIAISMITEGLDAHLSAHAHSAAQALRDAEGHQMTFTALLRQLTPP